jgi:hypothetical protein
VLFSRERGNGSFVRRMPRGDKPGKLLTLFLDVIPIGA